MVGLPNREQMNWICSRVHGIDVLDVGCADGTLGHQLVREGKSVIGIDIDSKAIGEALSVINMEKNTTNNRISFINVNVFEFRCEKRFDTVILADVLPCFSSSNQLLERVMTLLTDQGIVIISIPLGIQGSSNFMRTYTLHDLLEEIGVYFKVEELKLFNHRAGIVVSKRVEEERQKCLHELIALNELENLYHGIERTLLDKLESKEQQVQQLLAEVSNVNEEKQNLELDIEGLRESMESCNAEILRRLDSEEQTLLKYQDAVHAYNFLEARYSQISKKYDLLRNSKLGRLTLKYWKSKKRIPEDF